MTQYKQFHIDLVSKINGLKEVSNVQELFENPNKYGDVTTYISFDVKNEGVDYKVCGSISISYTSNQVFIPMRGYSILDNLNVIDVLTQIKDYYTIKIK